MFMKKKSIQDRKVLYEIYQFAEQKNLNWETAKQVLQKLCEILGEEVDCFFTVLVKERDEFQFTTLPEDEARYYINMATEIQEYRISGRTAYQITLESGDILEGIWLFEVPEDMPEEEVSVYLRVASELKYFLYSCILAQECEKQEKTDCFTGLPGSRMFEENLQKKLSGQEPGFLIVIRSLAELPKPYREDGINFSIINMAEISADIHPEGRYRIGPDMLAVLCREEKEKAFSVLQELMQKLPGSTFYLIPLSGLKPDNIYTQIQKGVDAADGQELSTGEDGIFPHLLLF